MGPCGPAAPCGPAGPCSPFEPCGPGEHAAIASAAATAISEMAVRMVSLPYLSALWHMVGPIGRVPMAETAIQFLNVGDKPTSNAELRALEQLDETVADDRRSCRGRCFRGSLIKSGRWQSQRIPSRGNYQYERKCPPEREARLNFRFSKAAYAHSTRSCRRRSI